MPVNRTSLLTFAAAATLAMAASTAAEAFCPGVMHGGMHRAYSPIVQQRPTGKAVHARPKQDLRSAKLASRKRPAAEPAKSAGLAATASGAMYTTSKFAVVGLSEAMRHQLAPFGIGVSVLCPGPVRTNIIANTLAQEPAREGVTPDERQRERELAALADQILQAGTPPDDVGRMVLAGVKENRLYIHTDRMMEALIEQRTRDLLDALPPW